MCCLKKYKRKYLYNRNKTLISKIFTISLSSYFCTISTPLFLIGIFLFSYKNVAYAAKLNDGTWTQGGSPGTTTITFTNTGALSSGNDIVITFPSSTATINSSGTNISCTNQISPVRTNSASNNTITITLDSSISSSTPITITMTDALTSYTTTTFAIDSLAINTQNSSDVLIDFGVALTTNDNTTTVTASVPLFVNMEIDTTSIDLGTLSIGSVNEADQTYTLNSNNDTGITVQIETDGDLDDGSGNDINYVGDGTVTAGQEEYGIEVDNVSGVTINGNYSSGDNDIIQSANDIATSGSPVTNGTFDINYKASISGTTVAGNYTQIVTVTVGTNA